MLGAGGGGGGRLGGACRVQRTSLPRKGGRGCGTRTTRGSVGAGVHGGTDVPSMPAIRRESLLKRACQIRLRQYRLDKVHEVNHRLHLEIRGGRAAMEETSYFTHLGIPFILNSSKIMLVPERIAKPSVAAPTSPYRQFCTRRARGRTTD